MARRRTRTTGRALGDRSGGWPMILFVCEGNLCRSALAEALLRHSLPAANGIVVGSAGTAAAVGEPADPVTAGIAARHGISLADHRARQLTPELLAQADMVLAATRPIRAAAVQTFPPAVKYSFTLRQMARILHAADQIDAGGLTGPARVAALARSANRLKGRALAPTAQDDGIPDPRGRATRVHEQSSQLVVEAVGVLAAALGGHPVSWVPARSAQRWEPPRAVAG